MGIKTKKHIISICLIIVFSLIVGVNFVCADTGSIGHCTPGEGDCTVLPNPINPSGEAKVDVPELIARIIQAILGVVGSIALLMFITGGMRWILSGGNEEQVTKGKNTIVWAVAGLAVVFMSYLIVYYIINSLITATTTTS